MQAPDTILAVAFSDAKNRFSALTAQANASGIPFVVTKNRVPWVEVRPLAVKKRDSSAITIEPLRREVEVPDIDTLFKGFTGDFVPREDGFAAPSGSEEL